MSQIIGSTTLANQRLWHHVSGKDRGLGRLAARIALTLMGKHKPVYTETSDLGDYVVVTNAAEIVLTAKAKEKKLYRWHTTYAGGLHTRTWRQMMDKRPELILKKAVSGMLPKNKHRKFRLERLYIYMNQTDVAPTILANCARRTANVPTASVILHSLSSQLSPELSIPSLSPPASASASAPASIIPPPPAITAHSQASPPTAESLTADLDNLSFSSPIIPGASSLVNTHAGRILKRTPGSRSLVPLWTEGGKDKRGWGAPGLKKKRY